MLVTDCSRVKAREEAKSAVVAACHRLAGEGALIGTAGNVSLALEGPTGPEVAITATGIVLAEARSEDIAIVSPTGEHLEGDLAASSELPLHLGLLAQRGGAVVHTHSAVATAVSLVRDELPCVHYQQLTLGGAIKVAPFAVFGTPELAAEVDKAMAGKQAAILANHGTVTHGANITAATENALLLEWVAELYWRAATIGEPRALTEAQQIAVIEVALARGYGATKGAEK